MSDDYEEDIAFKKSQEKFTKEKLRRIFDSNNNELVTFNGDDIKADNYINLNEVKEDEQ